VILGDAKHQHIFGEIPVRFAKFPERPADGVNTACRHIDRTEAAMGSVVWGAELASPPTCKRLALVAAGKEGEFARVGFADIAEPCTGELQRFIPFNFLEFSLATFANPF